MSIPLFVMLGLGAGPVLVCTKLPLICLCTVPSNNLSLYGFFFLTFVLLLPWLVEHLCFRVIVCVEGWHFSESRSEMYGFFVSSLEQVTSFALLLPWLVEHFCSRVKKCAEGRLIRCTCNKMRQLVSQCTQASTYCGCRSCACIPIVLCPVFVTLYYWCSSAERSSRTKQTGCNRLDNFGAAWRRSRNTSATLPAFRHSRKLPAPDSNRAVSVYWCTSFPWLAPTR